MKTFKEKSIKHLIELSPNGWEIQWIQQIQGKITEAWIGVNLKIHPVTCAFMAL